MAKLSAHGIELARIVTAVDLDADPRVSREEVHYSVRSDGHILRRHVVVFRGGAMDGERYDYGWKLWKRLKDPKRDTRQRAKSYAEYMIAHAERNGVLVKSTVAPL